MVRAAARAVKGRPPSARLAPVIRPLPTSPWVLDGARLGVRLPPPRLGEHDALIYGDWLGLAEEEIEALRRECYLGDVPLSHEL